MINEELRKELREDLDARRLAKAMTSDNALVSNSKEVQIARKIADAMHSKITGLHNSSDESTKKSIQHSVGLHFKILTTLYLSFSGTKFL